MALRGGTFVWSSVHVEQDVADRGPSRAGRGGGDDDELEGPDLRLEGAALEVIARGAELA